MNILSRSNLVVVIHRDAVTNSYGRVFHDNRLLDENKQTNIDPTTLGFYVTIYLSNKNIHVYVNI